MLLCPAAQFPGVLPCCSRPDRILASNEAGLDGLNQSAATIGLLISMIAQNRGGSKLLGRSVTDLAIAMLPVVSRQHINSPRDRHIPRPG
jgi:hypothetical protein